MKFLRPGRVGFDRVKECARVWRSVRGGRTNPESLGVESRSNQLPSDLIASRLWEVVLLFDNKEAKNLAIQERAIDR